MNNRRFLFDCSRGGYTTSATFLSFYLSFSIFPQKSVWQFWVACNEARWQSDSPKAMTQWELATEANVAEELEYPTTCVGVDVDVDECMCV